MRRDVSDRAVAAIVTATLIDFGIITSEDKSAVVDRQRIRREKEKVRKEVNQREESRINDDVIEGIYFDGKEIDTLVMKKDGDKHRQMKQKQEHIVVVSQPDGKFLTHVTPEGKAADPTTDALMEYADSNGLMKDVKVVGVDSTPVNTGWKGGILAKLEERRNEKLHWIICDLHTNELPLRHLMEKVDGKTSGNNSFKGPIGKALPNVENLSWNENFTPIKDGPGLPDMPDHVVNDLSSDQKYLFFVAKSIQDGKIHPQIKTMKPGPISHSRWLTMACRLCTLYLSNHGFTGKAEENLFILVFYVVTNYVPSWFNIKSTPSIASASHHILFQIQCLRYLPDTTRDIVRPFVKSWNAHPENLLVSMLCNEDSTLRTFAVQKIQKLRQGSDTGDTSVRSFRPPPLNYDAQNISELIDWNSVTVFESVLTCHLSLRELQNLIWDKLELPPFPTHTQSVERLVREMTVACGKLVGHDERDGFIRARMESRAKAPHSETKRDFAMLAM